MTAKTQLMTTTTLPLSALRIDDKSNVRKIGRGADAAFVASIKTRHAAGKSGIIQPLSVRPNGTGYVVTDGGKRLEAMQLLAKDGTLPADYTVPCMVETKTDAEAREDSLTSNIIRTDMHPVDEFRAFNDLHKDKTRPLSAEEIAARYGIGVKHVEQRLALGALDPVILDAWRDGQIDADDAKAFTLAASRKQQVTIFRQLSKRGHFNAWQVRNAIGGDQRNVGKLLNFVGREAYEKRGGKITQDLFGSNPVVSNLDLLKKMVQETFKETVEKLTADGWAFVLTERPNNYWDYRKIEVKLEPTADEKKQIAALEKEIKALERDENHETDREEEARVELAALQEQIASRSYTAKQKAASGCFIFFDHNGDIEIEYGRTKPTTRTIERGGRKETVKLKVKGVAKLANAHIERLRMQRMTALKAALVAHPFGNGFASMLAEIVAKQISDTTRSEYNIAPDPIRKRLDVIANSIAPKVMNAALRKAFDAKDYFESAPKQFTLAAITEAINADEARKLAGKKRPEIAKFAVANVPAKGWLPKELRTSHYDGPVAKAAAKAKPKSKSAAKRKSVKAKSKTAAKRKGK